MGKSLKIGITSYDDWNLLWETKVASNDKKMNLLYSVWGKTESESIKAAEILIENLKNK